MSLPDQIQDHQEQNQAYQLKNSNEHLYYQEFDSNDHYRDNRV
ncbi:MAG: hypothetical protein QNJ33_11630 [Crocosphaera sp.]|nr:hypothetical protein [Crocosphaera sp.]